MWIDAERWRISHEKWDEVISDYEADFCERCSQELKQKDDDQYCEKCRLIVDSKTGEHTK